MKKAYLGLGSNLGDRAKNLKEGRRLLEKEGVKIKKASKVFETEPWTREKQSWFFNQCLEVETNFSPQELLEVGQKIEKKAGQKAAKQWGPRLLDIDILFYENEIVADDNLQIPHPLLDERRFVLQPLALIAPDFIHPILNKKIKQLLKECKDEGIVQMLKG